MINVFQAFVFLTHNRSTEVSVIESDELEDGLISPKGIQGLLHKTKTYSYGESDCVLVRDALMQEAKGEHAPKEGPIRPKGLCACLSLAYYQPVRTIRKQLLKGIVISFLTIYAQLIQSSTSMLTQLMYNNVLPELCFR